MEPYRQPVAELPLELKRTIFSHTRQFAHRPAPAAGYPAAIAKDEEPKK